MRVAESGAVGYREQGARNPRSRVRRVPVEAVEGQEQRALQWTRLQDEAHAVACGNPRIAGRVGEPVRRRVDQEDAVAAAADEVLPVVVGIACQRIREAEHPARPLQWAGRHRFGLAIVDAGPWEHLYALEHSGTGRREVPLDRSPWLLRQETTVREKQHGGGSPESYRRPGGPGGEPDEPEKRSGMRRMVGASAHPSASLSRKEVEVANWLELVHG